MYSTVTLSNTIHLLSIYNNRKVYVYYNGKYYSITDYDMEIINQTPYVFIKSHGVSNTHNADVVIEILNEYFIKNLDILCSVGLQEIKISKIDDVYIENDCIIIHTIKI